MKTTTPSVFNVPPQRPALQAQQVSPPVSWWTHVVPEQFYARAAHERGRMAQSRFGRATHLMTDGGEEKR